MSIFPPITKRIVTTLVPVAAGGALGALARVALSRSFALPAAVFPWPTLAENALGAFLLGFLVARLGRRGPRWLVLFAGTGILGAFTTFATVSVEAERLLAAGRGALAVAYIGTTILAGLGLAAAGLSTGRRAR